MSVTIKLERLVASQVSLQQLGEIDAMPPAIAYRVSRAIRKCKDDVRAWADSRKKILKPHGKPHPQVPGELFLDLATTKPEVLDEIERQLEELASQEVTVDVTPMKMSDFGDKVKLKPNWLADLDWLIVE